MTKQANFQFSRRDLLKGGGALVVSIGIPQWALPATQGGVSGSRPPFTPDQLDSYLSFGADGNVTVFFGKIDMGQGVDTAIAQIVADELDVSFERVGVVMCDDDLAQVLRPPADRLDPGYDPFAATGHPGIDQR